MRFKDRNRRRNDGFVRQGEWFSCRRPARWFARMRFFVASRCVAPAEAAPGGVPVPHGR